LRRRAPAEGRDPRRARLAGRGERKEQLLLRRAPAAAARLEELVAAVGLHLPSLAVVVQVGLQAFADHAALERRVEDREAQLDAAEEIAVHPIGTSEVDILGAVVGEEEYARVLEEAADDRAHADVVRYALEAGLERA